MMRSERQARWHLITCEYPPDAGGVSDYTLVLASALAEAGVDTHVWCPRGPALNTIVDGVTTHAALPDFGPSALQALGQELDRFPDPRRLFVQWVPHGYGFRSMNVFFASWLRHRGREKHDQVHLMIHEPFLQFEGSLRQRAASVVHRFMLHRAATGVAQIWLSIPRWADEIRPYVPAGVPVHTLPIPAPPIGQSSTEEALRLRTDLFGERGPVVGHFGTFSSLVTDLLTPALEVVLAGSSAQVLLIGRGSTEFRARFLQRQPSASSRVCATGTLASSRLGAHLSACDALVQPYPDGISGRRTSSLALLRAGLPIVTNAGWLTEPFWFGSPAVAMVDKPLGSLVGAAAVDLLGDHARRIALRSAALDLYSARFDPAHAIAPLLAAS